MIRFSREPKLQRVLTSIVLMEWNTFSGKIQNQMENSRIDGQMTVVWRPLYCSFHYPILMKIIVARFTKF